ncbi:MAG: hypothetical protein ABSH31_05830 [Bryobacteraceae bacterium]
MESNIPINQLEVAQFERAHARVTQLLGVLRGDTERLTPDVESALTFRPDAEQSE